MSLKRWRDEEGIERNVIVVGCLTGGSAPGPIQPTEASARIVRALTEAVFGRLEDAGEHNFVRSIERCPLCREMVYLSRSERLVGGVTDEESLRARAQVMSEGPGWGILGHAELWISRPEGEPFVCATLIAHDVTSPGYEPPAPFIEPLLSLAAVTPST